MARVKRGVMKHKRHHKILKEASGYWGGKCRLFKSANEQLMKSGNYAYRDRRNRKREFRQLWIARINAACRAQGVQYSRFIAALGAMSGLLFSLTVAMQITAGLIVPACFR